MSASRYRLIVDGEDWEWKYGIQEMFDYADWLVEMPWHAPEAKADHTQIVDSQTGEVIYERRRKDHRPATQLVKSE